MVAILHLGFLAVGAGFLLAGYAAVSGDWGASTAAVHCWTIGAIGTMTLAMMTRASRGHTGSALTAPPSTIAIYALIILAIVARIASALQAGPSDVLLPIAGIAWVLAFAGFAVFYGPMLIARRRE
jgi:uncharacterized protein involved in response to NO